MSEQHRDQRWKGPTIREIADLAGVGTASVDRVLNNRPGVKEKTRKAVLGAMEKLAHDQRGADAVLRVRLFCESGIAFNNTMALAVEAVNRVVPGVHVEASFVLTRETELGQLAREIEDEGGQADGVIVVAREHPAVNRAIRKLTSVGTPVICLTTDLPSSRRSAYVGNDQYAAGSVAAQLIGQILPVERNNILFVMSAPFRAQQEREMGFRRVLRSDFPHLKIEERIFSDDSPETTRAQLLKYLDANGVPAAVYNVAGANRGVATALEERGLAQTTVFVGHELTSYSRALLESGLMDYVISHDFTAELTATVAVIRDRLNGVVTEPSHSQILIHTRYNCGL